MHIGDYVVRNKYNQDVVFQIYDIKNDIYYLKGVEFRLIATALVDDLTKINFEPIRQDISMDLTHRVLKGKTIGLYTKAIRRFDIENYNNFN